MGDVSPYITGGGVSALIMALAYAGRQAMDWWRERNTEKRAGGTVQVTDAATANAVLVQTMKLLQHENTRLQVRVRDLEAQDRLKDEKIAELEGRLAAIAVELRALKSGNRK